MNKKFVYILGLVVITSLVSLACNAQSKVSSSLIKGYWIVENNHHQFHNSDTLIFYKGTNVDKSMPKHHGKRPFIEYKALIKKGSSRVVFELNQFKRAICSEITFPNSPDTAHSKEWMWGKWQIENNILEIKSEHHYHWQFKIISIEKIKFKYENKNYSTIKLIAIKKKFINQD